VNEKPAVILKDAVRGFVAMMINFQTSCFHAINYQLWKKNQLFVTDENKSVKGTFESHLQHFHS
jgi:hypothetical protein